MDGHDDYGRSDEALGAAQHQVFTREDATAAGFTPTMQHDRRRRGRWVPMLPGVYRHRASSPTFRMRCMAAALWSQPEGLISFASAAALWHFEGLSRPADLHVLVPNHRRLRHPSVVVHRTGDLLPVDEARVYGIPTTSALRTVLDLAAVLDEDALQIVIEDGLRRGLFSVGQLEWRHSLRKGKGVPGSKMLGFLIARHGSVVTDSGWEVRVEQALVAAGLPAPVRQLPVRTIKGIRRVDLGYPGEPIVVFEYDSDRWHSGVTRRHRDMERRNDLRIAGCLVVEVNPAMLRDRAAFVAAVRPLIAPSLLSRWSR